MPPCFPLIFFTSKYVQYFCNGLFEMAKVEFDMHGFFHPCLGTKVNGIIWHLWQNT